MTTVMPERAAAPAASVTSSVAAGLRLVPAQVGRPGSAQRVHIECPSWCVLDHSVERVVALEDVSHRGGVHFAQVPTMGDDFYSAFEVYSQLYSDPASDDPRMRVAAVAVTDGSRDAYLTPDMADAAADELIAFALRMKKAARVARQANETAAARG